MIAPSVKAAAVGLIRERYVDFGPTLAHEKLVEAHGFGVSVETVRQWMIEAELWRVKPRRVMRVHQRRPRRACLGELVQADGSDHAWFEDRGSRCALIVFVDDATSRLLALRFVPSESTGAYMRTLRGHFKAHGRPVALYTDRHGIFRVNQGEGGGGPAQFTRALRTLDIEPIHAHSPQAKGRVERANGTLQDRLVKELRLRGIDDIETANAFLPTFMADYNARFAVEPASALDAHRPVLHSEAELDLIFSLHATRKISKNLTFQYARREYQPAVPTPAYGLRGATVTVCEGFDGTVTVLRGGRALPHRVLAQGASTRAAASQAVRGPSLEPHGPTGRGRGRRAGRRPTGATRPVPWICGRVLRTGARPAGRVGKPVGNASALPTGLPTLARLSPTTSTGPTTNDLYKTKKGTFLLWRKGDVSTLR